MFTYHATGGVDYGKKKSPERIQGYLFCTGMFPGRKSQKRQRDHSGTAGSEAERHEAAGGTGYQGSIGALPHGKDKPIFNNERGRKMSRIEHLERVYVIKSMLKPEKLPGHVKMLVSELVEEAEKIFNEAYQEGFKDGYEFGKK